MDTKFYNWHGMADIGCVWCGMAYLAHSVKTRNGKSDKQRLFLVPPTAALMGYLVLAGGDGYRYSRHGSCIIGRLYRNSESGSHAKVKNTYAVTCVLTNLRSVSAYWHFMGQMGEIIVKEVIERQQSSLLQM